MIISLAAVLLVIGAPSGSSDAFRFMRPDVEIRFEMPKCDRE
jgi:hypothetical protein